MPCQLADQIVAYRRELHQHPELSNQEFATTERITRWLQQAGIRILPLALTTGVVAEIGSGDGPLIALRGDIDALPIAELANVPFASRHHGVMHACGHDFHTAVMLGAAHLLKARESSLPGRVRIFFQPAEETCDGAQQLIDAGALDGVAAVFGLHNAPELPTGTFATRAGPFYANVDRFQIRITGKGAHAAKPEQGIDTIVTASHIVNALQTLPSRSFSSLEAVVVSVTRIEGGNTWNVLPQTVELEGTVRTHNGDVRRQVPDKIRRVIDGVAASLGAQAELCWHPGPPALINHPRWAAFSQTVAKECGYQVEEAELQMGGEDFAIYLHHVPGVFVSIGSASEFGLHHPRFTPDEQAIFPASQYFERLAERVLQQLAQVPQQAVSLA
ncbi:M20 peptidase aminoacylase family protein [Serratia rhizosphaerae]|uniref:Amidohydrolase n=1 Tax=Serratia rhizosphaerae TaxID=2597702 RepID=A0ABX6GJ41_9GAMM|nr:M20 peptidase aminoacylase family protein [Serratia rhizosphaerae]MEB6335946.1 M20 peptidase aminoacylase family protein [Serratia rhizosphaerae]QHA86277.1 amidohydrolase [Serratia rhizosphaerae]